MLNSITIFLDIHVQKLSPFHKPKSELSNSEFTSDSRKKERFKVHNKRTIIRCPLITQNKSCAVVCWIGPQGGTGRAAGGTGIRPAQL